MSRTIRRLDVPSEFEEGRVNDDTIFVIIDVMMFSSTVIALFENNVDEVIPIYSTSDFDQFTDSEILVGGERRSDETDFSNSPQDVYTQFGLMDTVPQTVALTSSNGARRAIEAWESIQNQAVNAEVVLGSVLNANATAEWINNTYPEYDVLLVCAGTHYEVALEDIIGSVIIGQELRGETVLSESTQTILSQLPLQKIENPDEYRWLPDEDIHHTTQLNESNIIPVFNQTEEIFEPIYQ
jgi:phosphosulfolactate phosphohydrolase-like enzyme